MPDRDERHTTPDSDDWGRWALTNRGRVPSSWAAAIRRDPMLRSAAVVVDLSLGRGQRRILLGPRGVELVAGRDGKGRPVHLDLAEEPELSERIEVGEPGPSGRSVAVSIAGWSVGAGGLLATGWPLAGRGEVSLVADGVSWDDRLVWVRGPTAGGVDFGRDDEMVDLTVDDPPISGAEVPPWILDSERWPNIVDASVGRRVPIVVGRGLLPCPRVDHADGIDTDGDGSPDVPAGIRDEFLVAYGHGLDVDRVWVSGTVVEEGVDYTVHQGDDGLHLAVTTLRFDASAIAASAQDAEVHARVVATDTAGIDLGSMIRTLLADFGGLSGRVSDRLFAEFAARSSSYGPDSTGLSVPRLVINEPARALDFVANGLLASYPYVSLAWDGSGVGPVVIDHRAAPVVALVRGRGPCLGRPEGGRYKETPTSDLRTSFSISWGFNPVDRTFAGVSFRNRSNSALCELAAQVIDGDQADSPRESVTITDSASAEATLDWLCEHRCRPSYEVDVEMVPEAWFLLRLGDTVSWSDSDLGFETEPAIVVGRSWSRGLVTVTLRVYPRLWKVGGGTTA